MSRQPEDLHYAETHEWVAVEDGVATIGISTFAIEQLSDLVFMELPEVGKTLNVGDEFGEVESVKAVSPIYSPVQGEVVEVNGELPEQLEVMNEDPYGAGWMIKVRLADADATSHLMDHAAYVRQCSEAS